MNSDFLIFLNNPLDNITHYGFIQLIIRFFLNLFITILITRFIYYPFYRKKDIAFVMFISSTIVFILSYLLANIFWQIAFALGFMLLFTLMNFRSSQLTLKDFIYLTVIITTSTLNSLPLYKFYYPVFLFSNSVLLMILFLSEKFKRKNYEYFKTIIYEKIQLINPEKRQELINDLEKRTGLKINRIEIGRIDFLRDVVRIRIYYHDNSSLNYNDADDIFSNEENED